MATVWERAAHSVYSMFSFYFDIVILVISHFGFEGQTLVLIAAVSGHCFSFTFFNYMYLYFSFRQDHKLFT